MAKILQVANMPLFRFKTACFSQMSLQLQNGFARNGHFITTYPDRELCRRGCSWHGEKIGRHGSSGSGMSRSSWIMPEPSSKS